MSVTRFQRNFVLTVLSLGLVAPAAAEGEDALGQFLEQNFPAMHSSEIEEHDPIRNFVTAQPNTIVMQKTSGSQTTSQILPVSGRPTFQQYDFINHTSGSSGDSGVSSYSYSPLLNARSALVMNADTGKILYQKNMDSVRPIASISKLMSAMVLLDAKLNMSEEVTITADEIDRLKGTGSRLSIGTSLTRAELLHIGLMSSENRAMHALGRTYPGGMTAFVSAMNAKARSLGMNNTRFYEPTGLDPRNVSTARDLSVMVRAANKYPQIRSLSTSNYGEVYTSAGKTQTYKNTNSLVRDGSWDISLQKTGYIKEAGRSMVLQAQMGQEPLVIVVLGSSSSSSRVNDARKLGSMVYQAPL